MKNDSFTLLQRRLTRSSRGIDPEMQQLGRFNTSKTMTCELTSQEQFRKMTQALQKSLKQQKQKRQELQEKLQRIMKRSYERQQQFHKILSNLDTNVYLQSSPQINITKLYSELTEKIKQSDEKMKENLEVRYQENFKTMERKIQDIMGKMEEHLKKSNKLNEEQNNEVRLIATRLESVALQIDEKNVKLMKENQTLAFRVQVLKQQKRLLIQELNQKKQLAKKYFERAKSRQSQRSNSEAVSQKESNRSRKNSIVKPKTSSKHQITMNRSDNYAFELVKSKVFSNELLVDKGFASLNTTMNLKSRKDYISSTLSSLNPKRKITQVGQSSRRNQSSLIGDLNKIQGQIDVGLNAKNSPQRFDRDSPEMNTIMSLRQVVNRERQKKNEFKSQLATTQHKLIQIDNLVVNTLILLKQMQETTKPAQKIDEAVDEKASGANHSQVLKLSKGLCDKIKSIITGNSDNLFGNGAISMTLTTTLNPISFVTSGRQLNNKQLLELLSQDFENEE